MNFIDLITTKIISPVRKTRYYSVQDRRYIESTPRDNLPNLMTSYYTADFIWRLIKKEGWGMQISSILSLYPFD